MSFAQPLLDDSLINKAAPPGSMRYFALLYAPEFARDRMMALFSIDAEIRDAARSANHDVAHTRLQWWRQEIQRLTIGAPQHPAARVLAQGQDRGTIDYSPLHEALSAAHLDLARAEFNNEGELRAYCYGSSGVFQEMIARVLAAGHAVSDATLVAIRQIGLAVRRTEILRDVRQDVVNGHIYFTSAELRSAGVDVSQLRSANVPAPVKAFLQHKRAQTQTELRAAVNQLNSEERDRFRSIIVLGALHSRLLDRIARYHYEIARERIELGSVERAWTAWRAARRGTV